ncbi:hypothetical protein HBB16_18325 [Pseudonocardia sp. MCCB 268]|nr:hypothetical protein [Pseudonocardia cytotoxica]
MRTDVETAARLVAPSDAGLALPAATPTTPTPRAATARTIDPRHRAAGRVRSVRRARRRHRAGDRAGRDRGLGVRDPDGLLRLTHGAGEPAGRLVLHGLRTAVAALAYPPRSTSATTLRRARLGRAADGAVREACRC